MNPPAMPQRYSKSTFGQSVFYVRFNSVAECQSAYRQREMIGRFDPQRSITDIQLADPCLRPEALDDLGGGRGPAGGFDGMPPAKRGTFSQLAVDTENKLFRQSFQIFIFPASTILKHWTRYALTGRFDGGPGFMGKQFRPVRQPRDVVDISSALHRGSSTIKINVFSSN